MLDSLRIMNDINDLQARVSSLVAEDSGESDLKAAELSGKVAAKMEELQLALENEDAERAKVADAAPRKPKSLAEQVLGSRDSFRGLKSLTGEGPVVVDADFSPTYIALPTTEETDRTLSPTPMAYPVSVLATLPRGVTDSEIVKYFAHPLVDLSEPDAWTFGNDKPEHNTKFTLEQAQAETVPYWEAVPRESAADYAELDSIITENLSTGILQKLSNIVINGKNTTGIVGLSQKKGSATYKPKAKAEETTLDSVMHMLRISGQRSGIVPTHVGADPTTSTLLQLMKDTTGHYLEYVKDGKCFSKTLVEDLYLSDSPTAPTKGRIMVYNPVCAQLRIKRNAFYAIGTGATISDLLVERGYVDKQLVQNAYTIVVEGKWMLVIRNPYSVVSMGIDLSTAPSGGDVTPLETDGTADYSTGAAAFEGFPVTEASEAV